MGEEQAKQEWLAKVLGVTLPNAGAAPAATGAKPAANPAKPASPANPAKPEAKAAKPAPNVAAALADAESFGVDPDDADTVGAGNPNLVSADLVGADARPQTTVTIHNFTGSNLILVAPTLKLPTARFVPAAPPLTTIATSTARANALMSVKPSRASTTKWRSRPLRKSAGSCLPVSA